MLLKLFGKYRFLVVSIALFLLFDLGVLVLNFYTSGKISQQTELINLAARQSTLSQQMSKATLYIKSQKLQQWVYQSGLDELREHYLTFGSTLDALTHGGVTSSPETGEAIQVAPVQTIEGQRLLAEANRLWSGFETAIEPMMVDILITDQEILPASEFIARYNLELFNLMTALTDHFSHEADAQTTLLRRAQVIGISLATINFFIILFHFLKQLRTRDRRLELKQHESEQILASIDDGVFLIDQSLRIGLQYSARVEEIFATRKISQRRFAGFLRHYVSDKTARSALDFVTLYFKDHVSADLIKDINPLKGVRASVTDGSGKLVEKYLDFTFVPLRQDDGSNALLVTVRDITASIRLREHEEKSEHRVQGQLTLFSQILPIAPAELDGFIRQSLEAFDEINDVLKRYRQHRDSYTDSLESIMQVAHKVKGDAQSIGLKLVGDQVHEFEDNIALLLKKSDQTQLVGDDILPITVALKQLVEQVELIDSFCARLKNYGIEYQQSTAQPEPSSTQPISVIPQSEANKGLGLSARWRGLASMAEELAEPYGVGVMIDFRGFETPIEPQLEDVLYPVAVQLIRNSIAHGLEPRQERLSLGKPSVGRITLSLSRDEQNNYRFMVADDGRGFDYESIRKHVYQLAKMAPARIKNLTNVELLRLAFSRRLSTQQAPDSLSGRGMGLPVVWQLAQGIGARLKVRSLARESTQFTFTFSWSKRAQGSSIDARVA